VHRGAKPKCEICHPAFGIFMIQQCLPTIERESGTGKCGKFWQISNQPDPKRREGQSSDHRKGWLHKAKEVSEKGFKSEVRARDCGVNARIGQGAGLLRQDDLRRLLGGSGTQENQLELLVLSLGRLYQTLPSGSFTPKISRLEKTRGERFCNS
jgi:hypothetical protein